MVPPGLSLYGISVDGHKRGVQGGRVWLYVQLSASVPRLFLRLALRPPRLRCLGGARAREDEEEGLERQAGAATVVGRGLTFCLLWNKRVGFEKNGFKQPGQEGRQGKAREEKNGKKRKKKKKAS